MTSLACVCVCVQPWETDKNLASISKQYLDLVPLRLNNDKWSFDPSETIRLSGAHGEEIVRSFHVSNEVNCLTRVYMCMSDLTA